MLTLSLHTQFETSAQAAFFSSTNLMRLTFSFLLVASSAVISTFASSVHAAEAAGRVIMARGEVTATSESGAIRNLKRRDSIFNHEIIKTGDNSKVQIRFTDNALLALKPNSELNIKSYIYSADSTKGSISNSAQNSQVIMELVAGGFRTLTGKIGKGNKEAYQVNTPAASIGIRGTLYEIFIVNNQLLAAVWKGGISLKTPRGQFNLGMDADFDFGEVSDKGKFTGLLSAPSLFSPQVPMTSSSNAADNSLLTLTDSSIPSPFERSEEAFSAEIIRNAILQQTKNGQLILSDDIKKQFEQNPDLFNDMLETLKLEERDLSNSPFSNDHYNPDDYQNNDYPNDIYPDTTIPDTTNMDTLPNQSESEIPSITAP